MTNVPLRIIKLGGSLLSCSQLNQHVTDWLDKQSAAKNVFIVGGGPWADAVRTADQTFSLDDETSHWLCIRAMGISARIFASLDQCRPLITDWPELLQVTQGDTNRFQAILDVQQFLAAVEPNCEGAGLPASWNVTSDSIAARVAQVLDADELVLLKSAICPAGKDLQQIGQSGYVDQHFLTSASTLPKVRLVHLLGDDWPERSFVGIPK